MQLCAMYKCMYVRSYAFMSSSLVNIIRISIIHHFFQEFYTIGALDFFNRILELSIRVFRFFKFSLARHNHATFGWPGQPLAMSCKPASCSNNEIRYN